MGVFTVGSIVLGIFVIVFLFYSVVPNLLTRVLHLFVLSKGPPVPKVALTFDDGPDADYTPRLLDELKKEHIVATFFVLGEKALRYPQLIERMVAEGHEVQIHGWVHKMVPLMLPRDTQRQVIATREILEKHFAIYPSYYRPTWGLCNWLTLWNRSHTPHLVTWSVMVGDWRVTPADELYRRVRRKLHPGAIVVLHDSDKTAGAERGAPQEVIRLIPMLAQLVHQQGYTFCKLSDW